jgi:hypothetical protein
MLFYLLCDHQIIILYLASKVFEDRLANKGLVAEFPDFEAVYHLVIDAVDSYNELWEDAYRAQQVCFDKMEYSITLSWLG